MGETHFWVIAVTLKKGEQYPLELLSMESLKFMQLPIKWIQETKRKLRNLFSAVFTSKISMHLK